MQSTFYPTVAQTYGVPLDTRNVFTKCKFPSLLQRSNRLTLRSGLANVDRGDCVAHYANNVHIFIS